MKRFLALCHPDVVSIRLITVKMPIFLHFNIYEQKNVRAQLIWAWKKLYKPGCFTLIVLLMSCNCLCSMALPHGAVNWSSVCDCGISDHTLLLFAVKLHLF